jgi:DNA-binding beta-propeller fold protein YncE
MWGSSVLRLRLGRKRLVRALIAMLVVVAVVDLPGGVGAAETPAEMPERVGTVGGPLRAQMYPSGMEIADDGTVVVADTAGNQVHRYSADGTLLWRIGSFGSGVGQFGNPRDVGVDSAGNVYVADTPNSRVVKLGPDGTWLAVWTGAPNDLMSFPMGLSVKDDKVYVADTARRRVRVLDVDGNQLRVVRPNGACDVFTGIRDADADSAGNIYIADYTGNTIMKLSPTGTCLQRWGSTGTGPGQFRTPYGVRLAFDPVHAREVVYVADALNNRIQMFGTDGTFLGLVGAEGEPTTPGTFHTLRRVAVATDGSGDVWGADLWGYRVVRFARTPTGYEHAQTIGVPPPDPTSSAVFHEPRGLTVDTAGNLHVVDTVHQRIASFDPGGELLSTCGRRGSLPGQFNWPRSVAERGMRAAPPVRHTGQRRPPVQLARCDRDPPG